MRKIRSIAAFAFLALGFMACSKEDLPVHPDGVPGQEETMSIMATISENAATRASLEESLTGYDVVWSEGDVIYIDGKMFTLCSGAGTTVGEFDGPTLSNGIHRAYYGLGNSTSSLPNQQDYREEGRNNGPMYAEFSVSGGVAEPVSFKNLCGLLSLSIKGFASEKIHAVTISADQNLYGSFYIKDNAAVFPNRPATDKYLNVFCHNLTLRPDGTRFCISLPTGDYTGIKISVTDNLGRKFTKTLKAGKSLSIERSKVTEASFSVRYDETGRLVSISDEWTVTGHEAYQLLLDEVPEIAQMEYASIIETIFNAYGTLSLASINYTTTGVDGNVTIASGVVAYPTEAAADLKKIVSIQHATCDIDMAPSEQHMVLELLPVMARDGKNQLIPINGAPFVGVMADYLGYGISRTDDLQHPYLHNQLTGRCCADMIRAAEEYLELKEIAVPSDLDLLGYSQGGAATLSTMLELLGRDNAGWSSRIKEVWAGAGPYDLTAFMDFFKDKTSYARSGYIPYAFRGIEYGDRLNLDDSKLYNSTDSWQAGDLESTLFSKTQVSTWHNVIGTDVTSILHPDFYREGFGGNSDLIQLEAAMRRNSIVSQSLSGVDLSKIKLWHSPQDDTVPYVCSENLISAWGQMDLHQLKASDHVAGAAEFLLEYCGFGGIFGN